MIKAISSYLQKHGRDQLSFLRELVLQPSYSYRKEDVDRVGALISQELSALPLVRETVKCGYTGDQLIFRSPACESGAPSILLVGHMDTVFPPESGFFGWREDEDKVYGPGVIDMKGGLAVAVFALKALNHLDLLKTIPITLLCNSDEEIGSPTSKELISAEAKKAYYGLVFESGGLSGELVTGRKGKGGFTLQLQGRAGHAAFAGTGKASAIVALAHKILEIEKLNDASRGLVVNVGVVEGGIGPNTVAEKASAMIDIRFLTHGDGRWCEAALQRIADQCHVEGTTATLINTSGRNPMEQSPRNRSLFQAIRGVAEKLGIEVKEELRAGVSDANTMTDCGLAVVDGMGPVGDCDHSDREYMIKKSLPEKTLLTASTLVSLEAWREQDAHRGLPFQVPPTEVCLPSAM